MLFEAEKSKPTQKHTNLDRLSKTYLVYLEVERNCCFTIVNFISLLQLGLPVGMNRQNQFQFIKSCY